VNGVSLRLTATVGKGATHGVLKDVIRKLKSDSPTLDLLGAEPGSSKPFTHVDDVVQALLLAGFDDGWKGSVNIGPNDQLSVDQLAEAAMHATRIYKPIKWLGEAANWKGDNRRLHIRNRLAVWHGWKPRYETSWAAVKAAARELS
jgi:UDP-glucose 4-epimerase